MGQMARRSDMDNGGWKIGLLCFLASCSAPGNSTPPGRADGPEAKRRDTHAQLSDAADGSNSADPPTLKDDARRLVLAWCTEGGGGFDPPKEKPHLKAEDWRHGEPLPSCDMIQPEELGTWKSSDGAATLRRLEAVVENEDGAGVGPVEWKEILTVRTADKVVDFEIASQVYDTSGEVNDPDIEVDLESVVFRDVLGSPEPDFVGRQDISSYGNFEADRCIDTKTDVALLLLCDGAAMGPHAECVSIRVAYAEENTLWSDQSECLEIGEKVDPEHLEDSRFELTYKILENGEIVVTRAGVTPKSATPAGPKTKTYSLEEISRGELARFDVGPSWPGI